MPQKCNGDNQGEIKTAVCNIRGTQRLDFAAISSCFLKSDFLSSLQMMHGSLRFVK